MIDPESGRPFELYAAQERFLREAFTPTDDGRLPYPEAIFSCPKKSGKTATAAMATLFVIVALGGPYAEGYCVANDFDQAQGRVFQAIGRIIEASPLLRDSAKITANRIEFPSTGAMITAIASDFAGAAGSNPTITVFDELWGYTSERSQRLWDEMIPVPTRKVSIRLTTTYAGFESESELLEGLYKRGLQGDEIAPSLYRQPGLLMFWSHTPVAPWQTADWLSQMRGQLRPNAYLRLIENRWVTSESTFVPVEWWDACVDPEAHPELADPRLSVWCGVDASVKRDSTAIVCATFDTTAKRLRLVWHRVFQPSAADPLDFEATIEGTLLDLRRRFNVREVRFDPWQMQAVAQRLTAAGLPMIEFPQSVPNLTEASTNLYEAIKGQNLIAYPDDDVRLAISRCVAIETARGWRIAKEKASHKIDVIVALAQAALGAVRQGQAVTEYAFLPVPRSVPSTGGISGAGWGGHDDAADDARADARRASAIMRARRSRWAAY
ncbi:MAG TPA: terminase TerL endonuclease subunit [Candidatus Binataceae bacterium]|nr:terminase TerL endonuclease subunit [Candidatus Binataceae bacterium]